MLFSIHLQYQRARRLSVMVWRKRRLLCSKFKILWLIHTTQLVCLRKFSFEIPFLWLTVIFLNTYCGNQWYILFTNIVWTNAMLYLCQKLSWAFHFIFLKIGSTKNIIYENWTTKTCAFGQKMKDIAGAKTANNSADTFINNHTVCLI